MVSLDLPDNYFFIPMRLSHQHVFRFALLMGDRFQFWSLCFALRAAPRIFSKVVSEVIAAMHKLICFNT